MRVHRLISEPLDREVVVAEGITAVRYADRPAPAGHHHWGIMHACPGVAHDEPCITAPLIASDLVSEDPLEFSPSILCMGAGRECGLHGFIRDGAWVEAGTPADTLAYIREHANDHRTA